MKTRRRVLVVDDDDAVRRTVTKSLGGGEYEVLTARDGMEGLDMARAHRPDLVVVDVMMPRLDGYGMLAEMMNDPFTNHIPVLMLTGLADQENMIHGLNFGADDYVAKPFNADELRFRIKNLIARSRHFVYTSGHRP
ncbi:MAG: response regulator [Elusimicrobiota bacterium]